MAEKSRITHLFTRLANAKLDKSFLRSTVLPSWWDDSLAISDAGFARLLAIISRHLSIDIASLLDPNANISCPDFGKTNFKKYQDVTEDDVQWAKCISLSAARIALKAVQSDNKEMPPAGQIRNEILSTGAKCVNLENLVEYIWAHGVPILHVAEFPKGTKKMAGLAARVDGRPVIVLSKNHRYNSLMLFDLAHELGHIICKHIDGEAVIIDSHIDRSEQSDPEEIAANKSALEILTGNPNLQYVHTSRFMKAPRLAQMAIATGNRSNVDPGFVAQNFAHGRQLYGLANAACKIIEGDRNPIEFLHNKLLQNLDIDELAEEEGNFLLTVAAGGVPNAMASGQ